MKRYLLFVLLLCSVSCYSQKFIGNSDFVYAKGVAKTQIDAENAALLSLSNTIGAKVTNVTSYSVTERNGSKTESYRKDIGVNSSITLGDEVDTYVETQGRKYIVYKYINKREYINRQKQIYKRCLALKDSIYRNCTEIKHSKNLMLGQYYFAYMALNTPIMDAYSPGNIELKDKLLKEIKECYVKDGRFGFMSLYQDKDPRGYYARMLGQRTKGVYGFEYLYEGKWVMPQYYYFSVSLLKPDGTDDAFSHSITPRCLIVTTSCKIHYRLLYEYQKDGELYRIDVPESWYFKDLTIDTIAANAH